MGTDREINNLLNEFLQETKDLYADFGVKTTSVPLFVPLETKELPSRDWKDEDGEDVYFPDVAKLKAYDIEISVVYKGSQGSFMAKQESLFKYMTTNGSDLNIYSPYSYTGCKGAYFKGFSDFDFTSDVRLGDVAEFKMKFRVTKPEEQFIIR